MALHGLADMTLGVRNIDTVARFYDQFGLARSTDSNCVLDVAMAASSCESVAHPYRRLARCDDRCR